VGNLESSATALAWKERLTRDEHRWPPEHLRESRTVERDRPLGQFTDKRHLNEEYPVGTTTGSRSILSKLKGHMPALTLA
jgi:hypothetical protein